MECNQWIVSPNGYSAYRKSTGLQLYLRTARTRLFSNVKTPINKLINVTDLVVEGEAAVPRDPTLHQCDGAAGGAEEDHLPIAFVEVHDALIPLI